MACGVWYRRHRRFGGGQSGMFTILNGGDSRFTANVPEQSWCLFWDQRSEDGERCLAVLQAREDLRMRAQVSAKRLSAGIRYADGAAIGEVQVVALGTTEKMRQLVMKCFHILFGG